MLGRPGFGVRLFAGCAISLCVVALLRSGAAVPSAQGREGGAPQPGLARSRAIPADQAVVSGRVVEAVSGRPVQAADVRAQGVDGTVTATTNADGDFELTVTPGRYTVAARAAGFVESFFGQNAARPGDFGAQVVAAGGRLTRGIDITLQAAGVVGGRVLDAKGNGIPSIEVELVRAAATLGAARPGAVSFALTDEAGSYRLRDVPPGDYVVRAYQGRAAAPAEAAPAATGEPARDYVSTFYPGVRNNTEASPLRIFAGQELLGVDFALATSRQFVVRGTLVDPGATSFSNLVVRLSFIGATGGARLEASVDGKGRFQFGNVPAGDYLISVGEPQRGAAPPMPGGGGATSVWMSASRSIVVDDDVDVELRAVPPARVTGRVLRDAESAGQFDGTQVRVGFVQLADGGGMEMGGLGATAGDGVLPEVPRPIGSTYLDIDAPPGWMVKAVRVNGADAGDGPIEFQSARYEIDIVLTDRVGRVSGVVVDRKGSPLPNHSVLLFPADPSRWFPLSRFIRQGRTDNDGRFQFDDVSPAVYQAVALPALPLMTTSAAVQRGLLHALSSASEVVRVGEGQQVSASLRATALPDGLQLVP